MICRLFLRILYSTEVSEAPQSMRRETKRLLTYLFSLVAWNLALVKKGWQILGLEQIKNNFLKFSEAFATHFLLIFRNAVATCLTNYLIFNSAVIF